MKAIVKDTFILNGHTTFLKGDICDVKKLETNVGVSGYSVTHKNGHEFGFPANAFFKSFEETKSFSTVVEDLQKIDDVSELLGDEVADTLADMDRKIAAGEIIKCIRL